MLSQPLQKEPRSVLQLAVVIANTLTAHEDLPLQMTMIYRLSACTA